MKKWVLFLMLVVCVSLSGAALPKSASANNVPYHTIKSKSYANILPTYRSRASIKPVYVWNNNLTQKRYNMKNSPNANWYVTKSYKMTNGKRTGIFYRIENPGKTITGLVWRGYLSRQRNLIRKQEVLNSLPGTIYDAHLQKILMDYLEISMNVMNICEINLVLNLTNIRLPGLREVKLL
ncbi:hypothetical protein [Lentilactobacillus diolivorans]|uniref:D-alanyl-D-alanine carboxypeptidase n=1 Tax=Lentilactobacillus diolivorans DSM 14421 TaxID=1423739 RepID=A0A0R1S485_9LACO|nr:hypothetical protein [Lentilactobacillus diolivorans]KRL64070.1 hypothetical protein FC85_GL001336 [Lentilactobacillus diolivorans DSM 14421]